MPGQVSEYIAKLLAEANAAAAANGIYASRLQNLYVDVKEFDALGNGTTDDSTVFETMITAIGTLNCTVNFSGETDQVQEDYVFLTGGDYLIESDLTFPSNIEIRFSAGAKLVVASGVTVTINGVVNTDYKHSEIFTGLGTVTYNGENRIDALEDASVTATDVSVVDTEDYFNGSNVETVLAELGEKVWVAGYDLQTEASLPDIAFNTGTRTFTASVKSGSSNFYFWSKGKKIIKTTSQTVVIPDVTGTYYIYFDNVGVLQQVNQDSLSSLVFYDNAITGLIYWNATSGGAVTGDELHGVRMSAATHEYNHKTFGARYASGLAIEGLIENGTTYTQTTSGAFWDEDIEHMPTALSTATFVYRLGATGEWTATIASNLLGYNAGGTYDVWNEWTGSTWQLTEGTVLSDYFITFFIATPDLLGDNVKKIIGQNSYSSANNARDAIETEIKNIVLDGLPNPEFIFIGAVIVNRDGQLQLLSDGSLYLDLRDIKGIGAGSTSSTSIVHNDTTGKDGGEVGYYGHIKASEQVLIDNLSGTNTGDQDLSPYFHKTNDDSDDITEGTTNYFVTADEKESIELASGDVDIYVNSTGNDSTGDGTSSFPYKTIAHALSLVPKNLNTYFYSIIIDPSVTAEAIEIENVTNGYLSLTQVSGVLTALSLNIENCDSTTIYNCTIVSTEKYPVGIWNSFVTFSGGSITTTYGNDSACIHPFQSIVNLNTVELVSGYYGIECLESRIMCNDVEGAGHTYAIGGEYSVIFFDTYTLANLSGNIGTISSIFSKTTDRTILDNTSGTNTGDETATTIDTILKTIPTDYISQTDTEYPITPPATAVRGFASALIAKGLLLYQSITNGNMLTSSRWVNVVSVTDGILLTNSYRTYGPTSSFKSTDIYYLRARVRAKTSSTGIGIGFTGSLPVTIFSPVTDQWYEVGRITSAIDVASNMVQIYCNGSTAIEVDGNGAGVQVINLTQAGHATATLAEVASWTPDYWEGFATAGIQTITSQNSGATEESIVTLPAIGASLPGGAYDSTYQGGDLRYYNEKTISNKYTLLSGDITSVASGTNLQRVVIPNTKFTGIATLTAGIDGKAVVEGMPETDQGNYDVAGYAGYFSQDVSNTLILVPLGTYADVAAAQADLAGTEIYYQLATPVVTELTTLTKQLLAHEDGTIYVTPTGIAPKEISMDYCESLASQIEMNSKATNAQG